jgi:ubiquinone biosynthesis protein
VLLRLFQTSRRFNVEVQPQLVLLQKTLLNIEGLGVSSIPTSTCGRPPSLSGKLDGRAGGPERLVAALKAEAPLRPHAPQLPRLLHQALAQQAEPAPDNSELLKVLIGEQQRTNRLLSLVIYFALAFGGGVVAVQLYLRWHHLG